MSLTLGKRFLNYSARVARLRWSNFLGSAIKEILVWAEQAYSIGNNTGDVVIMLIFGVVGYLMRKFCYDGAPMVLALVLGGELESSLRQSLMLSRGDFSIFITRPISLAFLVVAILLLVVPIITQRKKLSALAKEAEE